MDQHLPRELVDAVRTAPDAASPRLAVAEWLKQNGEPVRSEVVELSTRRRRLARSDAEHVKVSKTLAKWARKAKEWIPAAPEGFSTVGCEDGLIRQAAADASMLATHGAADSLPFLEDLTLTFDGPAPEVLQAVGPPHLDRLSIKGQNAAVHALEALRAWDGTVRRLSFGDQALDNRTADAFKASWDGLSHVEAVELQPGESLDNLGLEDLLAGGTVRDLTFHRQGATLLNLDPTPSVRCLDLGTMDLAGGQWGNAGYSYPALTSLRHQNMSRDEVSAMDVLSQGWTLKTLDLYQPRLGDRAADFLAAEWDALEALHLRQDTWDAAGWKGFERDWPSLRKLQLQIYGAQSAWYRSLHALAPQLEVLHVSANVPFIDDLIAAPWPRLHTLLLGSTEAISPGQVDRLMDRSVFPDLRYLFVAKDHGPDKEGLRQLRKAFGYGLERAKRMNWSLTTR